MPTTRLTAHFTLDEMTISETAARHGIRNMPHSDKAHANLLRLAETMERVRSLLGDKPILITSGYRGPEVNRLVGGSTSSAHMHALAADFICPGFGDALEICHALRPHMVALHVDQLIYEFDSWVHLGLVENSPRYQTLTIDTRGTRHGFG